MNKMKKLCAVLFCVTLLVSTFGCAGSNWNIPAGNQAILTAIEMGGYGVGVFVKKSKTPSDDAAIAAAYKLAREGVVDVTQVQKALDDLKLNDEELAGATAILLKRMGAVFDENTGTLMSLSNIPVEYWDAAAEGYVLGYGIAKTKTKAMGESAVKPLLPKKK